MKEEIIIKFRVSDENRNIGEILDGIVSFMRERDGVAFIELFRKEETK